ncbi:MAG TPA: hypothetical protein VGV69_09850 [Solirubrobacterales bacterium]|nr:hypothetical protein [Solirubrobacterales bacterium]
MSRPARDLVASLGRYVQAIRQGDEEALLRTLEDFVAERPRLAPFAFAFGGVAMLFAGLKLLVTNWRLTLVQLLPAIWIWLAMYDLRLHLLRDSSPVELDGPVLVPIGVAIAAITAACFYLNAVFAFAIAQPGTPEVRPAVAEARPHLKTILGAGAAVGVALAICTTVLPHGDRFWFTLSLGVVVGVMMVAYVAVPARLIGLETARSPRDRLAATAVGGLLGVLVSAPPYLLGRIGLLMIGSSVLRIPGILLFAVGVTLQAGATGAVRAMKMGAKLSGPAQERGSGP